MCSPFAAVISIRMTNCYVICLLNYSCNFIWEETYISNITSFTALSVFMHTNVWMLLLLFVWMLIKPWLIAWLIFTFANAVTSHIHDCKEWSSSDISSGEADICNSMSSANKWCMIVLVDNGRQRLGMHCETYMANNWTINNTWAYRRKIRIMIR